MTFSIALQTAALFIFTDYAKSIFADSDVNHASNRFVESSHTLHIASRSLRAVPGSNAFLAGSFSSMTSVSEFTAFSDHLRSFAGMIQLRFRSLFFPEVDRRSGADGSLRSERPTDTFPDSIITFSYTPARED